MRTMMNLDGCRNQALKNGVDGLHSPLSHVISPSFLAFSTAFHIPFLFYALCLPFSYGVFWSSNPSSCVPASLCFTHPLLVSITQSPLSLKLSSMAAPTQNSDASLEELVVSRTSTSTVSSEQTKRRERVPLESSRNAFEEVVPLSTSGSSNYSEPIRRWDVFINHRGLDTKHPLATSIYDALKREGLEVFLDQPELDLGDLIPATIQEAMESSFLHIAILSPRFAESPWCLAELAFMLQTDKHIIPVFYKVDPSDIRWTAKGKGIYAAAFSEHEESNRYSSDKLEEWKLAVQNVSYRTGCYIVEKNDYDEDRQVKDIVSTVLKIVQKRESLWVADYPAGVHNTGIISSGDGNVQAAGKTNYGSSNWTIGGKK